MLRKISSLLLLLSAGSFAETNQCLQSHVLKINTQSEFDFKGKNVTRHKFESYLSTKPLVDTKTKSGTEWWGLQLTEVKQLGNGEAMPDDLTYSLPFAVLRVTQGKQKGQIKQFYFPVELPENEQNKLKGLAYYLQFVEPSGVPIARNESDTIGEALVHYQIVEKDQKSAPQFEKSKQQYVSTSEVANDNQTNNAVGSVEVVESQQLITPSEECWFESMRGKEHLNIAGSSDAFSMVTRQSYSLNITAKPVESLLAQLPDDLYAWGVGQEQKALTPEELKQLSAEFKKQLNEIPLLELRGSELAQWLKKFDLVIDDLEQMLEEGLFDDDVNKRIFNALGHLDTANGNKLLVDLMSNEVLSETERFRAMRAITTGTSPLTEELTEQMLELLANEDFVGSDSLRGSAIMALGAVINRRDNNEFSEKLLTELSNKVSADSSPNERAALIASLGNAGREDSVDLLSRYQSDETPRVRANVAASLGQIGGEEAHKSLSNMLHNETDNRAQQAIFGAMGQFEMTENDISKMTQLASDSSSERARGQAIKALANQKHQPELVQSSLRNMMKNEKSRKNFTAAARALTAINKQSKEQ